MSGLGMASLADSLKGVTPPSPPPNVRKITTDEPIADKEQTMPRGVYDRKKKGARGGEQPKPKRKYTSKKPVAQDLKSLALDSLLLTASHLETTVRDQVEIGDNPELTFALDSFARAKAIYEAA